MGQTLGISETVGVVAMVTLTVAGASTVYLTTSDTIENTEADVDLEVSNLEPVSCYHFNGKSEVTLQNSGESEENLARLITKIGNKPINVDPNENVIEPGENTRVTIEGEIAPDQAVKFIPGKSSSVNEDSDRYRFYPCSNLVDVPNYVTWANRIYENGTGNFQTLTIRQTSVRPFDEDLCLGKDCSGKGLNTDYDSNNDYINVGGDRSNGTVSVNQLYSEGDICFGEDCPVDRERYGVFVSEKYPYINGTLDTDGLDAQNSCLGSNCPN